MPEEGGGNLDIETRCMQEGETGEHVEIEARCRQKIGEKEAGGRGEVRHRNKDERKKLLRREAEV